MYEPNIKEKDYCQQGHNDDLIIRTLLKRELINGKTIYVLDIDNDTFFRKNDIDLLLINKFFKFKSVEVKADGFPILSDGKKYIFLELISNSKKYQETNGKLGQGCILTSKCDYFIFYFIKYDYYLIVESEKLKKYILENRDRYPEKRARTWSPDNSQIWYYSVGHVVPIDDIVEHCSATIKYSRYKYDDIKKELGL